VLKRKRKASQQALLFVNKKKQKNFIHIGPLAFGRSVANATAPV
jgi:hypothetical protein